MAPSKDQYIDKVFGGDYKIQKLIGKGGMSRVYKGQDQNLKRDVAIKIITLDPDRAKELMKRFEREGTTMARLEKHTNIISVYRSGNQDDTRYLAMEYIDGKTLTEMMNDLKDKGDFMSYDHIIQIMRQVADALDFAHRNDVIHRDIKPSNIMIEDVGERAVLMDFGLVMQTGKDNTTMGTAFGTPRYISPEQAISSQQAVAQSDQYSLAVIIFEILTHKTPFDDDSAMSLALSHITNEPPNPQDFRADIPDEAVDVLLRALEKSPEDRYDTVSAFIEALADGLGVGGNYQSQAPAVSKKSSKPKDAVYAKKENKTSKESIPSPIPKRERVEINVEKQKTNRNRLIVGAVLLFIIAIFAGAALFAAGGGDDDDGNAGDSSASSNDDLKLEYTNDFLVIYNQSGDALDLRDLELVSPDAANRFIFRDIGATTLSQYPDEYCTHYYILSRKSGPPDYCELDEEGDLVNGKEFGYTGQINSSNLYWVWLEGGAYETFNVVYKGDILTTCQAAADECTFSLPE